MNRSAPLFALSLLAFAACDGPRISVEIEVAGVAGAAGTVVVKRDGDTIVTCSDYCVVYVPRGASIELTASAVGATTSFAGFSAPCGATATCTTDWKERGTVRATFRPRANIAFVTSKTVGMPLGDSAAASQDAADAFCQARAEAVKLPGHYVAWLSTHDRTAPSKLAGSSGWLRTDGKPYAGTPERMARGEIYYPLEYDENRLEILLDPFATPGKHLGVFFTGTHVDGAASADNCSDYTINTGDVTVGAGMNGPVWTDFPLRGTNKATCAEALSLACFEVGANEDVTPHDTGRVAFLTRAALAIPMANGRDTADQLCASEAAEAGLPGDYLAFLASSKPGGGPLDRFDISDGALPWVRPDGVRLVDKPDGMNLRALLAPVGVTAHKEYVDEIFWAGSDQPLVRSAPSGEQNCAEWTDPNQKADSGSSDRSWDWYHEYLGDLCQVPHRVLCLQK